MSLSGCLRQLLLLSLLALAACSTPGRRPATDGAVEEGRGTAIVSHWRATGRVAVKVGDDGLTAQFDWQQEGDRGQLSLHGPFGAGALEVTVTPEHIRLASGGEPALELDAPFDALDSLMVMHFGFALPLAAMPYWVIGVPQPGLASEGEGRDFEQFGWHVSLDRLTWVAGAPMSLPGRLEMTRGDTRLRWWVDQWRVTAP